MKPVLWLASATAFSLLLAGCEERKDAAEAEKAPQAGAPVTWSAVAVRQDDARVIESRLPADPELAALVPSTELFPGQVGLNPAVPNPYAGNAQAIAAGERHFAAFNCAGCHAPLGGGGMGPPLSDSEWIYGDNPAQIYLTILHGRPQGMPAWGGMLPRKTIWELVAYVETLPGIQDHRAKLDFDDPKARRSSRSSGD